MLLKTVTSVAALALLLGASSVLAQSTTPQRPTPTPPSAREAPKAPVAGQIVVQDGNTLLAAIGPGSVTAPGPFVSD